jgi:predicted ABC-type transport system involved in lysophospholipase L1 biosynthesis ATPase subunit
MDRVLGPVPLTADNYVMDLGAGRCQALSDAVALLEQALTRFAGALVMVTHDAALAHAVGQQLVSLDGAGGWSQENLFVDREP